jgi:hypothetical protein
MEREIDVYRLPKKSTLFKPIIDAYVWKRIWSACCPQLEGMDYREVYNYHEILAKWIPIINYHLKSPISSLEKYDATFHYLNDARSSKEILHFWIDIQEQNGQTPLYITFNVPLFKKLLANYNSHQANQANFLVDADRGTINLSFHQTSNLTPSEFFKRASNWYLLFIATCHALAHLDCHEKFNNASYDKHDLLKKSLFYNLCVSGSVKHQYVNI